MKVDRLLEIPDTECVLPAPAGAEISAAFTSDLLSDVMANAAENSVLITIQAHQNTVAVASLVGIRAILACSARAIPADMLAAARAQQIAIFRTSLNQFDASIAVHQLLASR
jgi:bifunctional DNase/RNase